jgi:hypothetical protein
MFIWHICGLIETLELVLNASGSLIYLTKCNANESYMFNLIIQFRVCFQPITISVTQDAILLCYSCQEFQRSYFIYSPKFYCILIVSHEARSGYKTVYISSLVYLKLFLAWMWGGQTGTRSEFSPVFTCSIIRPMNNKTIIIQDYYKRNRHVQRYQNL